MEKKRGQAQIITVVLIILVGTALILILSAVFIPFVESTRKIENVEVFKVKLTLKEAKTYINEKNANCINFTIFREVGDGKFKGFLVVIENKSGVKYSYRQYVTDFEELEEKAFKKCFGNKVINLSRVSIYPITNSSGEDQFGNFPSTVRIKTRDCKFDKDCNNANACTIGTCNTAKGECLQSDVTSCNKKHDGCCPDNCNTDEDSDCLVCIDDECESDSNPCTDEVCVKGTCRSINNDANICSGSEACTVDTCQGGDCKSTSVCNSIIEGCDTDCCDYATDDDCEEPICNECTECDTLFSGCDFDECKACAQDCYYRGIKIFAENCIQKDYACTFITQCSNYHNLECVDPNFTDFCNVNPGLGCRYSEELGCVDVEISCGDGICSQQESNCCQDCGCEGGLFCDDQVGACVECLLETDCTDPLTCYLDSEASCDFGTCQYKEISSGSTDPGKCNASIGCSQTPCICDGSGTCIDDVECTNKSQCPADVYMPNQCRSGDIMRKWVGYYCDTNVSECKSTFSWGIVEDCNDGDDCTSDSCSNGLCRNSITCCRDNDSSCPSGCSSDNDNDCTIQGSDDYI
ncbi:hypothetical protein GOV14_04530 [Candidatus Pacearchaeota archaeon]|nr:hypothetical protein [Candidatus Pacearchaeota archaeon]